MASINDYVCKNTVKLNYGNDVPFSATTTGFSTPDLISTSVKPTTVYGLEIPQLNHYIAKNWTNILKERHNVAKEEKRKEQNKIQARNRRLRKLVKHVHWSGNACIVYWGDGSRTVAHWNQNEPFDAEKAILVCMARKLYEDTSLYNEVLNTYGPEGESFFLKQCMEEESWVEL